MKLRERIRAKFKKEIAHSKFFQFENEIAGLHIWHLPYSNLETPRPAFRRNAKSVRDFSTHALSSTLVLVGLPGRLRRPNRRPARAYARVNQLCLFSASRPLTTTPASASFFSRLPVIMGVTTSRPISSAWL